MTRPQSENHLALATVILSLTDTGSNQNELNTVQIPIGTGRLGRGLPIPHWVSLSEDASWGGWQPSYTTRREEETQK